MAVESFSVASDLDTAWLNFEPDLPLAPDPSGQPHPFYVERPDNPADRLRRILLRPYHSPPKLFFSGHRGCGKSTELARLAADPDIKARFFPVHFSIRKEADINSLDYRDVLTIMGGQLYQQYRAAGGKLDKQLLKELDSWRGKLEEQITTTISGRIRISEAELEAGLDNFFTKLVAKVKLEPRTRHEIRQVLERDITGLLDIINLIVASIHAKEKRSPLILIDDLDKPSLEVSRTIFCQQREIMLQPACPIVYTVSSPLFYGVEFEALRDRAVFLPNIKVYERESDVPATERETLRRAVLCRMDAELISPEALDLIAQMSGGVFRELMRLMRSAVDRALESGSNRITTEHAQAAAAEIRGEYRRILNRDQRRLLARVHDTHQLDDPAQAAPLLQLLALLEYADDEPWFDCHPVLVELLKESPDEPADRTT